MKNTEGVSGAEVAMRGAAKRARRYAAEITGWVAVYKDGKIVQEKLSKEEVE